MFLQNQISDLPNHFTIINDKISKSNEIRLVVAYVRKNGTDALIENFIGKNIKLLCSFDMGITDPLAISELLNVGVDVKVYYSNQGTFHSKFWLFKEDNDWNCIIGSANLTKAALFDNVEASVLIDSKNDFNGIISNSIMFFNYLWNSENSKKISKEELVAWQNKIITRNKVKKTISKADIEKTTIKTKILFNFIKSWIDIDKGEKKSGVIGSLWRGWYIIPDHGLVNDDKIRFLHKIIKAINNVGGKVKLDKNNLKFKLVLEIFSSQEFARDTHSMSNRDLFIRQTKNYLIKFGWVYHPPKENGKLNKQILILTTLGKDIANCEDLKCVKKHYSNFFNDYTYNGLKIIRFTKELLEKFEYLDFEEFNYFVIHSYTEYEINEISQLISFYRQLNDKEKNVLRKQFKDYFKKIKEPTAKAVLGNYIKKVKHTMSAIGWVNGVECDFENWILTKKNKDAANI